MDVQPRVDGVALGDLVSLFHVPVHCADVRISPCPPLEFVGVFVPRQGVQHLAAPAELIQHEPPAQAGVIVENQQNIVDGLLDFAVFIALDIAQPCVGVGLLTVIADDLALHRLGAVTVAGGLLRPVAGDGGDSAKVSLQLGKLLFVVDGLHRAILQRHFAHRLIRWELADRGVAGGAVVLIAVQVQANKVKGVHKLHRAGVSSVMAVQEFAVIVDDSAARRAAARIGVPLLAAHNARGIDAGQKLVHRRAYVIGAAECAHDAGLCQRVALLECHLLVIRSSTGNLRPLDHVAPVRVGSQQERHRCQRRILVTEHIIRIHAGTRPVHEAACLKCGRVGLINANQPRQPPRQRLVLIGGSSTVKGDYNAQAGLIGAVLACGVDRIAASDGIHAAHDFIGAPAGDIIEVKRHKVTPGHCIGLAPSAVEGAAHEPADIL